MKSPRQKVHTKARTSTRDEVRPSPAATSRQAASRNTAPGEIRIIGGQWRSRRIGVPVAEGLRPTGDRIRETLFNWLGPTIAGKRCLDLFAGTGILGLEALSRGAASVDWLERNAAVARHLRGSHAALQESDPVSGHGEIHQRDALSFLELRGTGGYDVVFLDPPFAMNPWRELLTALPSKLAKDAKVYVEAAQRPDVLNPPPEGWLIIRESQAGAVWFALLQCEYSQVDPSTPNTQRP
ncbi:MAG: 16S rRNA (guanine(966)-N(2))-methyltransferase RsmD [Burkholderiales bacterium]|nr:16S rRNA (guanine(966)-N(2))-methyltransferase RsmD [Burkholderiales bacterium]